MTKSKVWVRQDHDIWALEAQLLTASKLSITAIQFMNGRINTIRLKRNSGPGGGRRNEI